MRFPVGMVMMFAFGHTPVATAAEPLDGTWAGSTSCAGAPMEFRIIIQGGGAEVHYMYQTPSGPSPHHHSASVSIGRDRSGAWVTLLADEPSGMRELIGRPQGANSMRFGEGMDLIDCQAFSMSRVAEARSASTAAKPAGNQASREPSRDEMLAAFQSIVDSTGNGVIVYRIAHFGKESCRKAQQGQGYLCSYRITITQSFRPLGDSVEAVAHAEALGPRELTSPTETRRFIWSESSKSWRVERP